MDHHVLRPASCGFSAWMIPQTTRQTSTLGLPRVSDHGATLQILAHRPTDPSCVNAFRIRREAVVRFRSLPVHGA